MIKTKSPPWKPKAPCRSHVNYREAGGGTTKAAQEQTGSGCQCREGQRHEATQSLREKQ